MGKPGRGVAICVFDECDEPVNGGGLCMGHYKQRAGGRALTPIPRPRPSLMRLVRKGAIAKTDECILVAYRCRPVVVLDGVSMNASRAVWIKAHGDPGPLYVLHRVSCANDRCLNVRHLYLGSQRQNALDTARGGRVANTLLTPDAVRSIRARYERGSADRLGQEFGVSPAAVRDVVARRTWSWVTP